MDNSMTLVGHLTELRKRLIIAVASIVVCSLGSYIFSEQILGFFTSSVDGLVFLSPIEAFTAHIKVSIYVGFLISLPIVVHQIWRFALPALRQSEKKIIHVLVPLTLVLFFIGLAFSFLLVVPVGLNFLLGFSSPDLQPMISLGNYISFVLAMTLPFGIVFQLPLIQVLLIRFNLVSVQRMASLRKHVIVGSFIVGALLTPPDFISQVMLAVPLLCLYELGMVIGRIISPRGDK